MSNQQLRVGPKLFAAAIIPLAVQHVAGLRETISKLDERAQSPTPTEAHWNLALAELLRAYFCLASLHLVNRIGDSDLSNLYGHAMLQSLCDYSEAEIRPFLQQVFDISGENPDLDDAVRCYLHAKPNKKDKRALEDSRRLLSLSEDNPLHWFAGKMHIRVMRILGIGKDELRYLFFWTANATTMISAWDKVIAATEPVFSEET